MTGKLQRQRKLDKRSHQRCDKIQNVKSTVKTQAQWAHRYDDYDEIFVEPHHGKIRQPATVLSQKTKKKKKKSKKNASAFVKAQLQLTTQHMMTTPMSAVGGRARATLQALFSLCGNTWQQQPKKCAKVGGLFREALGSVAIDNAASNILADCRPPESKQTASGHLAATAQYMVVGQVKGEDTEKYYLCTDDVVAVITSEGVVNTVFDCRGMGVEDDNDSDDTQ